MKQKINSPSICSYTITASSNAWTNEIKQTNSSYGKIARLFHKCKRSTFHHYSTWLQLSMTRQMQYNFLYPVHNITTVHCAVPLSLLTAQHSQTVLNTEQCGVVRQRAVSNSNSTCNYSNGDMLRQHNYIVLEDKNNQSPHKCTPFQHNYN
jgi:hypothetical protein